MQFTVKVDTGALVNVLPKHIFEKFGGHISQFKNSKATLEGHSGTNLGNLVTACRDCRPVHSDKDTDSVLFFITRHGKMTILGLKYSLVFKLLNLQQGVYTATRPSRSVNADEITSDMVHAVPRVPSSMYDYDKLKQKWARHLPLGKLTSDVKWDLMKIFPRQFQSIGFLPGEYEIDLDPEAMPVTLPNSYLLKFN